MLAWASEAWPEEACGVVLESGALWRCRNFSARPCEQFELDPVDYAAAEQLGRVVGIWHSHPDGTAEPSLVDRAMCERTRLPWHVVSHPGGDYRVVAPEGWQAPLVGRPYCFGVFDCWELVRDWYARERGIRLGRSPEASTPDWWTRGVEVLQRDAANYGFFRVETPEAGDLVMMQMQAAVPNHLGVWLGDGRILHHLLDRLSETHVWGGYWARSAVGFWRYRDE
ncbi:hypothetical protein QR66_18410 [Chromobacterium piscinae]|nr:hypothetical protein QR66_18410 [Chromobacterium piscinae]